MSARSARREVSFALVVAVAIGFVFAFGPSRSAHALEALDGRIQAHGFVESQVRVISEKFGMNNQEFDLAMWYNILNVELEFDILPDGWGPVDLLQAYVRVEARYDCIYTHGCGMFNSVNTFGNDAQRLPKRLRDARDEDYSGVIQVGDPISRIQNKTPARTRGLTEEEPFGNINPGQEFGDLYREGWEYPDGTQVVNGEVVPICAPELGCPGEPGELLPPTLNPTIVNEIVERVGFPGFDTFYKIPGADLIPNSPDDPGTVTNGPFSNYRWALKNVRGPAGGAGRTQIVGPWLPKNTVFPRAALKNQANPFRGRPTTFAYTESGTANQRYNTRSTDLFDDPLAPILIDDPGPPTTFTDLVDPFPPALVDFADNDYYDVFPTDDSFIFDPFSFDPNQKFGGDYSGMVPCTKPNRDPANRPITETQGQIDGTFKFNGCQPFSNIRVTGGKGELPMRVAPDRSNLFEDFDPMIAQGLYIPSPGLRRYLGEGGDFDNHHFNITERERSWNRGASQQDNKEVKEAFIDVEWLDSRLWTRFGLQNIVWGKTELFRTTDQFNPQDFALQTIPGLEEARIALWAARFVYSLYNVGPLEDVRFEFAANFDDIEPNDLGGCGEPYTFDVICSITTGMFAHGLLGLGVAGVDRPRTWDDHIGGLEVGGRIEWRWDRFSFALTDFYGYNDFPFAEAIYYFERSVEFGLEDEDTLDFVSGAGRPLADGFTTGCTGEWGMDGDLVWASANRDPKSWRATAAGAAPDFARVNAASGGAGIGRDPACLKPGGAAGQLQQNGYTVARDDSGNVLFYEVNEFGNRLTSGATNFTAPLIPIPCDPDTFVPGGDSAGCEPMQYEVGLLDDTYNGEMFADGWSPQNALENHTANQQSFAWICSGTLTIGASLDPNACAWTLFGSPNWLEQNSAQVVFSEVLSCIMAGDVDRDCTGFLGTVSNALQGTRTVRPSSLSPLNRDANDGVITAQNVTFVNRCPSDTLTNADGTRYCPRPPFPADPFFPLAPNFETFLPDPGDMLTLDSTMTNEQRALLGCGPYYGTRCDTSAKDNTTNFFVRGNVTCELLGTGCTEGGGIDFLNMEASALLQSFVGIEGTNLSDPLYTDDPRYAQWAAGGENWASTPFSDEGVWLTTSGLPQPGTVEFVGGPRCTRFVPELNDTIVLPGCRGANAVLNRDTAAADGFIAFQFDAGYDPTVDGCMVASTIDGIPVVGEYADGTAVDLDTCFNDSDHKVGRWYEDRGNRRLLVLSEATPGSGTLWHPYAGCWRGQDPTDPLTTFDCITVPAGEEQQFPTDVGRDYEGDFYQEDINLQSQIFRSEMAAFSYNFQTFLVQASCDKNEDDIREDPECFDPRQPFAVGKCSWVTPQYCTNVKGFFGAAGVLRNTVRAGGNERFGRRTFIWQSGGELVLKYEKRNVFGFAMDFGEDTTKSNWGVEFTWVNEQNFFDNNDYGNNVTKSHVLNLTVSADRPTFINFLNANRTFFINTQWFFQYITNHQDGFTANGPVNVLATFAVFTGYFQDRLNPLFVVVYDFNSRSGGILPSVTYRFTEAFSVGVGVSFFFGETELVDMSQRGFAPAGNRTGKIAYKDGVNNLLSNFREKDELWLKLRWTF